MATLTYDALASTTLTSSASSVTFSSLDTIAAGYRDLVLVVNKLGTDSAANNLQFNADSSSSYSYVNAEGAAGSTFTNQVSATNRIVFGAYTYGNGISIYQIMDFSANDKHKSVLGRVSSSTQGVLMGAGRWANTAAITEILIFGSGYPAGSTFSLYGIVA